MHQPQRQHDLSKPEEFSILQTKRDAGSNSAVRHESCSSSSPSQLHYADPDMLLPTPAELDRFISTTPLIDLQKLIATTLLSSNTAVAQEEYGPDIIDAFTEAYQYPQETQPPQQLVFQQPGAFDSYASTPNAIVAAPASSALNVTGGTAKDEPQMGPRQGTQLLPIDMRDLERAKLEKRRLVNRISQAKCRKRKLDYISRLEAKEHSLEEGERRAGSRREPSPRRSPEAQEGRRDARQPWLSDLAFACTLSTPVDLLQRYVACASCVCARTC
ncbi:hypothetical protein HPB50_010153 [Hyalomma asiaticum]|uniref:Uncharacterized protein n=1 Tax=Hyalomma asiaticum TaxID=266040 RepID=A0ACB7T7P9_HYAAI|nr:hypothetical protein HPB50_010153 [Hyalomma asiaticum]